MNLSWANIIKYFFLEPDNKKFPSLDFARTAIRKKGTYPTALNAINEVAVNLFLNNKIVFADIFKLIEKILSNHKSIENPTLDDILNVEKEIKESWKL